MSTNTLRFTWAATWVTILGMETLFSGCGKSEESPTPVPAVPAPAPAPAPEAVPAPAPALPAAAQSLVSEIEAAADFVAIEALQQKYRNGEAKADAVDAAFAARWDALTVGMKAQSLIDGLEHLGVTTRATGENEYTISLLFRSSADLAEDYHLICEGQVFPANVSLLPEKNRDKGLIMFYRRLDDDPTSRWKKGEYHVVHIKQETPQIPYNLTLRVYKPIEGKFWNQVGGQRSLGWQWAARDEAALLAKISACATPADLYAIAPPGPQMSPAVGKALQEKWAVLAGDATPKNLIDSLEFVAVDTKATGEKEYTFSFLLRSVKDIDTNYHMTVISKVDPSHVDKVSADKKGATTKHWFLRLYSDPTSLWRAGEYHVAQLKVATEIIPYNLSIGLQLRDESGRHAGGAGEVIPLGWQADIRK